MFQHTLVEVKAQIYGRPWGNQFVFASSPAVKTAGYYRSSLCDWKNRITLAKQKKCPQRLGELEAVGSAPIFSAGRRKVRGARPTRGRRVLHPRNARFPACDNGGALECGGGSGVQSANFFGILTPGPPPTRRGGNARSSKWRSASRFAAR